MSLGLGRPRRSADGTLNRAGPPAPPIKRGGEGAADWLGDGVCGGEMGQGGPEGGFGGAGIPPHLPASDFALSGE